METTETDEVSAALAKLAEIHDHVLALAAEHPDYVYRGTKCRYKPSEEDPHGCLIGAAARRAGADLEWADATAAGAMTALEHTIPSAAAWPALLDWFSHVQQLQDGRFQPARAVWQEAVQRTEEGRSWAERLTVAKAYVAEWQRWNS